MSQERAQQNEKKAQLNNLIAQVIMGWHTMADDPRRLWRAPDGSPVRRMIWERHFNLCAHPWLPGINQDDDRSFDPAFNGHRSQIDWWQVVVDTVAAERCRQAELDARAVFPSEAEIRTNKQRIEALIEAASRSAAS